MNICFTSYRVFTDGRAAQPFLESDPANIAYALGGAYYSFFTLRNLSDQQLKELFEPYDWVIVALDVQAIELVARIIAVCEGRAATYSEGHIADYQRLAPAEQVSFLEAIRAAKINFLYWEKYVPFYRALTNRPVEYLPYPYLLEEARRFYTLLDQRQSLAVLPSGFAGATRNGLATLAVAKRLCDASLVDQIACWLEPESFDEDCQALNYFFFSAPITKPARQRFSWRKWLTASRIDYRGLLKLKTRFRKPGSSPIAPEAVQIGDLSLYRRSSWINYLTQLARARILIDLNNRETVGRNALDCAALGIPCVSTDRSDLASKIFPETTLSDPWDITAASALCQRLLRDDAFYKRVVEYAETVIEQFDVNAFQQRFHSLVAKHRIAADSTHQPI